MIWILLIAICIPVVHTVIKKDLMSKRYKVDIFFNQIDPLLDKRYELLPDFIAKVRNYLPDERSLISYHSSCWRLIGGCFTS